MYGTWLLSHSTNTNWGASWYIYKSSRQQRSTSHDLQEVAVTAVVVVLEPWGFQAHTSNASSPSRFQVATSFVCEYSSPPGQLAHGQVMLLHGSWPWSPLTILWASTWRGPSWTFSHRLQAGGCQWMRRGCNKGWYIFDIWLNPSIWELHVSLKGWTCMSNRCVERMKGCVKRREGCVERRDRCVEWRIKSRSWVDWRKQHIHQE